jgi:hypothetical protein
MGTAHKVAVRPIGWFANKPRGARNLEAPNLVTVVTWEFGAPNEPPAAAAGSPSAWPQSASPHCFCSRGKMFGFIDFGSTEIDRSQPPATGAAERSRGVPGRVEQLRAHRRSRNDVKFLPDFVAGERR